MLETRSKMEPVIGTNPSPQSTSQSKKNKIAEIILKLKKYFEEWIVIFKKEPVKKSELVSHETFWTDLSTVQGCFANAGDVILLLTGREDRVWQIYRLRRVKSVECFKSDPRRASVSCQLSLFWHSESERSRHAVKQHLLGKYWKYSTGLTDCSVVFFFFLYLVPFRSDPITCAWSQHCLGLRLDLLGQPLRGQHRLAAADDPESQGGTDPPAHSLPSFTRCN